ncbi:hypothetical protein CCHR01_16243 [Colletotrichum chrysophilum]|uniref:Uncharacterized protein n=1 Tax=Colletotrichum chrysophilum TaxID=1836956 RepID=A0AAD9E7Y9_9PEZI|nr:hypothetical protein CCHR01_16243 [Colletotrichum chrysophilum]
MLSEESRVTLEFGYGQGGPKADISSGVRGPRDAAHPGNHRADISGLRGQPWHSGGVRRRWRCLVVVAAPVLTAAGFGAEGVIVVLTRSAAMGVHSAMGNIAASSVFAVLQSAGARGYGVAAEHSGIQLVGGAVVASGALSLSKTDTTA